MDAGVVVAVGPEVAVGTTVWAGADVAVGGGGPDGGTLGITAPVGGAPLGAP